MTHNVSSTKLIIWLNYEGKSDFKRISSFLEISNLLKHVGKNHVKCLTMTFQSGKLSKK